MLELLNNTWVLLEAAEVREPAERDQFMSLYYAVNIADDARQPWMPAGLGSDEHVNVALVGFEAWARSIRDLHRADDEDSE
jgi:hypothetical protein